MAPSQIIEFSQSSGRPQIIGVRGIPSAEALGQPGVARIIPFRSRRISAPIYTKDSAEGLNAWRARVEQAHNVSIESEIARRGIRLNGHGAERCGPCPKCGGDDRFSINTKKQTWNCRHCKTDADKGDVIGLICWLEGVEFVHAVEMLTPQWRNGQDREPSCKKIIAARFDYEDENGALLFQVERVEFQNPDGSWLLKDGKRQKKFQCRRPDPHGKHCDPDGRAWSYNLEGVRRVPYRLPEVLEAIALGHPVLHVEGPAKADLLWRWGIPATCFLSWSDEFAPIFAGGDIIIMPDNDAPGREKRDRAARAYTAAAAKVRVLELPNLPPKGDIIDWEKAGGTAEQLLIAAVEY